MFNSGLSVFIKELLLLMNNLGLHILYRLSRPGFNHVSETAITDTLDSNE